MFVGNVTNLEKYLATQVLVITSDAEYGTHIYFKHGYKAEIEFSFYTESEDLKTIIELIILNIRRINDK